MVADGGLACCRVHLIGANAARLAGRLRRRWQLFTLGLVLATWTMIVVMYATHPWTAKRWATYWPIYYG